MPTPLQYCREGQGWATGRAPNAAGKAMAGQRDEPPMPTSSNAAGKARGMCPTQCPLPPNEGQGWARPHPMPQAPNAHLQFCSEGQGWPHAPPMPTPSNATAKARAGRKHPMPYTPMPQRRPQLGASTQCPLLQCRSEGHDWAQAPNALYSNAAVNARAGHKHPMPTPSNAARIKCLRDRMGITTYLTSLLRLALAFFPGSSGLRASLELIKKYRDIDPALYDEGAGVQP